MKTALQGTYLHWEDLRRRKPPGGLDHEEWWAAIKLARNSAAVPTPLIGVDGNPFSFVVHDDLRRAESAIDRRASGQIVMDEDLANPEVGKRYVVSSLIEEAITSSQLEGAATTRKVAANMIRSQRSPRNKSERMILNNYHAIEWVSQVKDEPLTPELVFELHRILTQGTLDDENEAGTFRKSDSYAVQDERDNTVLHVPPPHVELGKRMDLLCDFANMGDDSQPYVHPVIRSILLHFWLAYDHPFTDGNGRTARALFYWSMLHRGYWLVQYISISQLLKRAYAKYPRSFLYTETDGNDLTYFILYQLGIVNRAIDSFYEYLAKKIAEVRATERLLQPSTGYNHRQIALLGHAMRHQGASYTIKSHQTSHGVVYQTARADLLMLEEKGLLVKEKIGRKIVFRVPEDFADLLKSI